MIFCDLYRCDNCGCEFYYPISTGNDNATSDNTVYCPKCGSNSCQNDLT